MLARIRKSTDEKEQGFTLIELLVVMIIIGILAAIAIPVFLNQRVKARETAAKSDASNISKEVAAAFVDGSPTALTLTTAVGPPRKWNLSTTINGNTQAATGPLSDGNSATVTWALASPTVYCVKVTPSLDGTGAGNAWSAGNNGLKKGATCP